jgi:hypothetical protein
LWYEVSEPVVTNWDELPAEQKPEKGMLIFLVTVLGTMLMLILVYWAEAYRTYYTEKHRGFSSG